MQGLHLTADLSGCDALAAPMRVTAALRTVCLDAVSAAGLTVVGEAFHAFPAPGGITGVLLLAESHLAVHTWPELGRVTLDVFVCNLHTDNHDRADAVMSALTAAFQPGQVRQQWLRRGGVASD